jgi:glucose uptake protein
MNWLIVVCLAYLFNAIAISIDKALLKKEVPNPAAYTFYISALGAGSVVLLFFDFKIPTLVQFVYNFLAGATFTVGLYLMFVALQKADVSRVTPFIGGLNPFFIFILAALFLGERMTSNQLLAFFVILAGTFLISLNFKKDKGIGRAFLIALPSAIFYAISYAITKYVFNTQTFISGFVFIRLGAFIAALFLLLSTANRRAIFSTVKTSSGGSKLAFGVGQTCGALSAILVNWAISLASVSLVNALQGLQYVFLFIIILGLKNKYPKLLDEDLSRRVYIQKVVSIGLIVLGLFLISI